MTAKKTPQATKIDAPNYNRLVAHATLRDIRLIGTKLDLKPDAIELAAEPWIFKVSAELEEWVCDNEARTLTGTYSYNASCTLRKRKLLVVACQYVSTYELNDLCDEDAGREFLARVGRYSAYPYFRGVFATLTQQSGLMLPPLPLISEPPRWVTPPA